MCLLRMADLQILQDMAAREGSPITLIDGNELVRLVIKYELYIIPVKTYVLDEFYNTEE